jgi:uncharacterized FlgJ-related protein
MYICILLLLLTTNDYELILRYYDKPLTIENVRLAINETDIQFKPEVLELIKRESGNLHSKLATKGNNIFGLRKSRKPSTDCGTIFGYAKFKHFTYSIIAYRLWQQQSPPRKNETYAKYLKRRRWN